MLLVLSIIFTYIKTVFFKTFFYEVTTNIGKGVLSGKAQFTIICGTYEQIRKIRVFSGKSTHELVSGGEMYPMVVKTSTMSSKQLDPSVCLK